MSKVRFLQDFQGKETKERFYSKGQEVEIEDFLVSQLVTDGRVEVVAAPVADVHKDGGAVEVVEHDEVLPVVEVEPEPEPVEEVPPTPKKRKGRK